MLGCRYIFLICLNLVIKAITKCNRISMRDTVKYILLGDRCQDFLKAHYDIGINDACRLMEMYLSTFRRMTNMPAGRVWPFKLLRGGIETAQVSWDSIKRHREDMMRVCLIYVFCMLFICNTIYQ